MIATLQISKVEDTAEWLESVADGYTASQSIHWLVDQVGTLCGKMAFVNSQMATAKKELSAAKRKTFESAKTAHSNLPPSLLKDYVASLCEQQQYNYDVCERTSRTIVHTLDVLRTCISALKEEVKLSSYQGQS